ncbi:MAG: ADP-ribosylglycohydrolase family protein [Kiritimatiellaeota bacterium]|nr:ADP-ribosylglycohydrolase family protein [Kiritimatiellota bacterium]
MKSTTLFKKVYGSLMGGAIGDAMGGPVEGLHYREIEKRHGKLTELLPYPAKNRVWGRGMAPGSVTDDTYLKHICCDAVIRVGGVPTADDIARQFIEYYHTAPAVGDGGERPKQFMEEFYWRSLYREHKMMYGGGPLMASQIIIAPVALVDACDPEKAARDAFLVSYMAEGYAKDAGAITAAAIAEAVKAEATVESVIEQSLNPALGHLVEGIHVGRPCREVVETAVEIARRHGDVFSLRDEFYAKVNRYHQWEALEALGVSMGLFCAANGDPRTTIIGAVNYGRDNDSLAGIAGAVAGAFGGIDAIPAEWVETVKEANPELNMEETALSLCEIVVTNLESERRRALCLERLLA